MLRPSPPRLAIPSPTNKTGSPSTDSATTPTGRPSLWTKSAQRKMTRLYVYTTLPLQKIVELVYCHTPDLAPGHESAHKKLNFLLDKEPRWLHPRSDSDMSRRVNALADSPTRLRSSSNTTLGDSRSTSDSSWLSSNPQTVKIMEDDNSPASFETCMAPTRTSFYTATDQLPSSLYLFTATAGPNQGEEATEAHDLSGFLRRTTHLSNSTNQTTGSFHRVLADYSEPYVQTVKRLVKRFTAPIANRDSMSPSLSDGNGSLESWFNDEAPSPASDVRPPHLPGDYLSLDEFSNRTECCVPHDALFDQRSLSSTEFDSYLLPWVSRNGLTSAGQRILKSGPTQNDAYLTDSFGNTVLHFLAARGSIGVLNQSLETGYCRPWIAAKNSAGQTFLHVLDRRILENPEYVGNLLAMIAGSDPRLIHSRDCYGRSFFHLLRAGLHSQELLDRVAALCDERSLAAKDAFGFSPAHAVLGIDAGQETIMVQSSSRDSSMSTTTDSRIIEESRLLATVRLAAQCPSLHDDHGRNGLHCLAKASLGSATIVNKYHLQPSMRTKVTKKYSPQSPQQALLDSSTDKLKLRLGLLRGLLDAGVDANQHDDDGNTPLMLFVAELPEDDDYKIPPKILEALVRNGANVNARNRRGETALHMAVQRGRKLAMRTLVKLGANVHVRDCAGRSLLDVADAQMANCESDEHMTDYAHYEACRAWLSGKGMALQRPTVLEEWGQ
ncbi:hypothetical protein E4U43_003542 [Claviceps pusilla]|uniref:Ankyrin n=1 Tax=Claviceps pusilla TaxID=123648 RepID=A0A9P7N4K4_9HYPO|nr:hypothetical protein E4U43_003542 [Claviceps pusilla]